MSNGVNRTNRSARQQEKDERSIFGKAFTGVELAKTRLNTSDMVYNCLLSCCIIHTLPGKAEGKLSPVLPSHQPSFQLVCRQARGTGFRK